VLEEFISTTAHVRGPRTTRCARADHPVPHRRLVELHRT